MGYKVALVGATGMVGEVMRGILEERKFPIDEVFFYSSARSAGKVLPFNGTDVTVLELAEENIVGKGIQIALFSAGGGISKEFAPIFAREGALVIDNSSAWRMDPDVPLVVPEVNPETIADRKKGIIANPNCSTIQMMQLMKILDKAYGLKRIIYSTYQAVAGAGVQGVEDLENGIKGEKPKKFNQEIAFNLIPQIDVFEENGYTKEEMKMIDETHKILGLPDLGVTATCVRVPVYTGHSESVNVELKKPFEVEDVKKLFAEGIDIIVEDDIANTRYPMPIYAAGKDEIFVGRIRRDESVENGLNFWVVADNIRKGAALNTVQIAEYAVAHNML